MDEVHLAHTADDLVRVALGAEAVAHQRLPVGTRVALQVSDYSLGGGGSRNESSRAANTAAIPAW